MATASLCKDALEYFKTVKKQYLYQSLKIMIPLFAVILLGVMAFILKIFEAYEFLLILVIALSVIAFSVILITIIFYKTNKPLYEILVKEFLKSYNYQNKASFKATTKPSKQEKAFLGSYLFPQRAFMRPNLIIEDNQSKKIYDTLLLLRNGQYTQLLFDGFYLQIKKEHAFHFQLRSKGKPISKTIEYVKEDTLGAYDLYIEKNQTVTEPINKLYQQITKFSKQVPFKQIYVSQTLDTLHIFFEVKSYKRRVKTIECPYVDYLETLYFDLLNFTDAL